MIRAHRAARVEQGQPPPLLVWRFDPATYVASTAARGGGLCPRRWIIHTSVPHDYVRRDLDRHLTDVASALGLSGPGIGMLAAADARTARLTDVDGVTVEATVGLTDPTWALRWRARRAGLSAMCSVRRM